MRQIKFRYRFDNHAPVVFKIQQIEAGAVHSFVINNDCTIKGRDQFTGLQDKNGKEIYEGDEIEYDTIYDEFRMPGGTGYWEWQRTRDYVVYRVDGFCLDMDSMPLSGIVDINQDMQDDFPFPDEYEYGIEVIGNIHDNPELL